LKKYLIKKHNRGNFNIVTLGNTLLMVFAGITIFFYV